MSRDRRRSPILDALEGKLLLSTTAHPHAGGHPPVAKPVPVVLDGTYNLESIRIFDASGTSLDDRPSAQYPAVVILKQAFSGQSQSLGLVHGSTEVTANRRTRTEDSRVILTTDQGSIRLGYSLRGRVTKHTEAGIFTTVRYRVVSGEGQYANARGAGTITTSFTGVSPDITSQLTLHTTKSS